ncbi:Asp23/Gls24 family envelope stress response protein [Arthrobacter sp. ERGS1:01]|uniref:Asp23/Gls24 family envelope stress response protein n=1 Tax=Arthrobacter sp. ERGS1:01 TaxID=1704044 RepID=UPI0006B4E80F|nr:Asp23/Gls24 family envelope stress response protein [Arthrobacter sp. ERGS1:01]
MNPTRDCGRRIEDLSDYLDTGTSEDSEHIDHCPQCQARLAGLRSLHAAALDLMDDDVAAAGADDSGWLDGMLANLRLETRAGRSIPLSGDPGDVLTETEGAVIALVRNVGDALGGVLIGRCRLDGEVGVPGAPVDVNINVSARYGYPLPAMAGELREAVRAELEVHTELNIAAVNVAFTDMRAPLPAADPVERGDQ